MGHQKVYHVWDMSEPSRAQKDIREHSNRQKNTSGLARTRTGVLKVVSGQFGA